MHRLIFYCYMQVYWWFVPYYFVYHYFPTYSNIWLLPVFLTTRSIELNWSLYKSGPPLYTLWTNNISLHHEVSMEWIERMKLIFWSYFICDCRPYSIVLSCNFLITLTVDIHNSLILHSCWITWGYHIDISIFFESLMAVGIWPSPAQAWMTSVPGPSLNDFGPIIAGLGQNINKLERLGFNFEPVC